MGGGSRGSVGRQILVSNGRVGGLTLALRLLSSMVIYGLLASKAAADDVVDQVSITGSACDIMILDNKIIRVKCSPDAGSLTLKSGKPVRFGISLKEKGFDGEYLIEEISPDDQENTLRQRRVADFIARCVSDSICQEMAGALIDSDIDACLQRGNKADAISFFEYNGDVLPLGKSGQLISCEDDENLTIMATFALGQSASEEYNPDTDFEIFVVARFQTGD